MYDEDADESAQPRSTPPAGFLNRLVDEVVNNKRSYVLHEWCRRDAQGYTRRFWVEERKPRAVRGDEE